MMEDRIKGEKIRQVERANHEKERQQWYQEKVEMEQRLASCAKASSSEDQRISQRDSHGHKWFKVAHYCSKHGYNISHTNNNCRDREQPGGHPLDPRCNSS